MENRHEMNWHEKVGKLWEFWELKGLEPQDKSVNSIAVKLNLVVDHMKSSYGNVVKHDRT